jgi:nanoRNase/pAp phosphatase (c-di-AMP/oligoRNAs hydrolase)
VSQDSLDLVDHKNVAIIDHHDTHCQNADKYKNATTIIELCTSCAKLIYTKFKHVNNISPHQQYLILLADDYDSYELKLKDSYNLNVVYWAYQGDRFEKFKRDFFNGFFEFNKFQHNIIKFNEKKLNSLKQTIDVFEATIPIQNTPVKFVSTFAESCINEIAEHIIQKHNSDIGLVVNLKSGKVSLRKSSKCDVHLGNLAKKLLNGGGHEYAAGGTLSDSESFVSLTKLFKPLS